MDRLIEAGDKVIAISEDDDTVKAQTNVPPIDTAVIRAATTSEVRPERTLVLGWNWRVTKILNELNAYVAPGSTAVVVAERDDADAIIARECPSLPKLAVTFRTGDITDRALLDALDVPSYDHVILLCDEGRAMEEADQRVLMTLLHLRDIEERSSSDVSIVSEMMDVRNRELADVTRADDFIVGDRLVSLLLAQVAENKELNALFADIFDPDGSEIYLKPAGNYVALGEPCSFYTVVESARRRGETAIGYRIKAESTDPAKSYGVRVNPKKSEKVRYAEADRVIVVAEN
jgi:hypothetical protein